MRDKLRTINFGGACAMFCALEPAAAVAVMRDSYIRRVRSHRNEINGNGSIFRTSVSRLHTHEPKHCVCVSIVSVQQQQPHEQKGARMRRTGHRYYKTIVPACGSHDGRTAARRLQTPCQSHQRDAAVAAAAADTIFTERRSALMCFGDGVNRAKTASVTKYEDVCPLI